MIIKSFEVNPFSQNTYLIHQENTSSAILFDVGFYSHSDWELFDTYFKNHKLELKGIFLTHAHLDHIFGLKKILSRFDVPVYLHQEDEILLKQAKQQAALFGFKLDLVSVETIRLNEQEDFVLEDFKFTILFTPGHAPGHLSFYFPEQHWLIAGDTLFAGSIGRTDLYKGDLNTLEKSIREKLYMLPQETIVYSGHGPLTTIKRESKTNSFVRAL
ncbi:MAG: MBL fold metallo-hydrolase [Bacteroidetes bacterium]|nr:MBL fold metallo-hydrolase [Bacteroidota bacterium]NCQ11225.1 MBL fold metallo-hydrolase [Bacteroidota bacterium]